MRPPSGLFREFAPSFLVTSLFDKEINDPKPVGCHPPLGDTRLAALFSLHILLRRTNNDLIDIHFLGLLNSVEDGASDRLGINGALIKILSIISCFFVS